MDSNHKNGTWRANLVSIVTRYLATQRARASVWGAGAGTWLKRHRTVVTTAIGVIATLSLVSGALWVAPMLTPSLSAAGVDETLRNVFVGLGSALIGATVITFSFVMFALQVNVERMPHGLFQRLSSDGRLLGAFLLAFGLSVGVLCSAFASVSQALAFAIVFDASATLVIVVLVLYSYRRALRLINPLQQLGFLLRHTCRDLDRWSRRATRAHLLMPKDTAAEAQGRTVDIPRSTFFHLNPHWTNGARQSIDHAMSLTRYYAERGDHEVSGAALNTLVSINMAYIRAKSQTFFSANPLLDHPYSTDPLLNHTLELLRQNVQIGVSRADEQQLEHTFRALAELVAAYATIAYGDEHVSKHHARLAAGYLTGAVKATIPHKMPDVLMEGARLIGNVARVLFRADKEGTALMDPIDNLALLAAVGLRDEDHRPVTQIVAEQLAQLTLVLLQNSDDRLDLNAKRIRESMVALATAFLQIPETPFHSVVTQSLRPYFSTATQDALPNRLAQLVNALQSDETAKSAAAARMIRTIEHWFDGLYHLYRTLLQVAVTKKSHFTFDLVHGMTHYASVCMALSNAPACGEDTKQRLEKHATWLLWGLTWIPDSEESVQFAETFQIAEVVFRAALDALRFGSATVFTAAREVLLAWILKAGKYQTGWGTLERGILALTVLALRDPDDHDGVLLLGQMKKRFSELQITAELRGRTVDGLMEVVRGDFGRRYASNHIDHELSRVDGPRLRALLQKIITLLDVAPAQLELPAPTAQPETEWTASFDNAVPAVERLQTRIDAAAESTLFRQE